MVNTTISKAEITALLQQIKDPEIPALSIQEMGMLRDVVINDAGVTVLITPTYSGCPAMGIIAADIKSLLESNHISPVTVSLIYSPAWTTDWMSPEAKEKMRIYGIAPPLHSSCSLPIDALNTIPCPQCLSTNTMMLSRFGSTACKCLYKCNDCKEPFEHFKCH
jgi:ring-1,2-phenylacetyl-CoA epoxidase subunit PaaD